MPKRHAHARWQPLEQLEQRQLLATITWDGGAATNSWHDAANWSTDTLPGPNDDVVINDPSAALTIQHTGFTTTVKSINNFEGLALSGGKISTSGLFRQHGPFTMSGGQVAGAGDLRIFGDMTWTGGAMVGPGRTYVFAPAGNMVVSGDVVLARLLENYATVDWQSGNFKFNNGTFVNRPTGTLHAKSPGLAHGPGTNKIINNGVIRRNGTSATVTTFDVRLTNLATVEVIQGTLRIRGGGTSFSGSIIANPFTTVLYVTNTFVTQAAATVSGNGFHAFNSGAHTFLATFTGVGTLSVQGATLVLAGPAHAAAKVVFGAGVLKLSSNLSATTSMTWTGGRVEGPGRLVIPGGASLVITGAAEKYLQNVVLETDGNAVWGGGRLNFTNGVIENGGTFRALGDRFRSFGGASRVENTGVFRKELGSVLFFSNQAGGIAFNNRSDGELIVQAGTLSLFGGGLNTGSISGSGTSSLVLGGVSYLIAGGTITGIPSITVSGPALWTAGSILGPGQIVVTPGFNFNIQGPTGKFLGRTLANNGTLSWTGGILQLISASIVNAQGATMNIGAVPGLSSIGGGSAIDNLGTINKIGGAQVSFEFSSVSINNSGTLNVLGGSLSLDGSRVVQMVGATLAGGTWNVLNGAALHLVGSTILINNATISLSGLGAAFGAISLLSLNNGSLTISNASVALQSNGAQFTNDGAITLNQGGSLTILGKVILHATSTLNVTFDSASVFGRLIATGALELAGTVSGSFLFSPPTGSLFQFLTGASRSGEFTAEVTTGLPNGLNGDVLYFGEGARWAVS